MEYKGVEYTVMQTSDPHDWKWTVQLDATRKKTGSGFSRALAMRLAQAAIDRAPKVKPEPVRGTTDDIPPALESTKVFG